MSKKNAKNAKGPLPPPPKPKKSPLKGLFSTKETGIYKISEPGKAKPKKFAFTSEIDFSDHRKRELDSIAQEKLKADLEIRERVTNLEIKEHKLNLKEEDLMRDLDDFNKEKGHVEILKEKLVNRLSELDERERSLIEREKTVELSEKNYLSQNGMLDKKLETLKKDIENLASLKHHLEYEIKKREEHKEKLTLDYEEKHNLLLDTEKLLSSQQHDLLDKRNEFEKFQNNIMQREEKIVAREKAIKNREKDFENKSSQLKEIEDKLERQKSKFDFEEQKYNQMIKDKKALIKEEESVFRLEKKELTQKFKEWEKKNKMSERENEKTKKDLKKKEDKIKKAKELKENTKRLEKIYEELALKYSKLKSEYLIASSNRSSFGLNSNSSNQKPDQNRVTKKGNSAVKNKAIDKVVTVKEKSSSQDDFSKEINVTMDEMINEKEDIQELLVQIKKYIDSKKLSDAEDTLKLVQHEYASISDSEKDDLYYQILELKNDLELAKLG